MVQVDVFWGYGWGAVMAAAAGKNLLAEKRPFYSEYFVKTVLFLSLFWAPTGMLLLIRHPSWETMQVAHNFYHMNEFLVLGFGLTNITQGILGFWVGYKLMQKGHEYLAHLNWLLGYYGMFFILLYGWDGLGYDRFLYDRDMLSGSPAWIPGAGTLASGIPLAILKFLNSSVAWTLYTDGLWLLPPFFWMGLTWTRANGHYPAPLTWLGKQLFAVFGVGLGAAMVSALTVNYVGHLMGVPDHVARALGQVAPADVAHLWSYVIGLPLSWGILYAVAFRPGAIAYRYLTHIFK